MSYQFGHVDRDERIEIVEEAEEEELLPPRRLGPAVLAVAMMAVFAGGLWFAYFEGTKHGSSTTPSESGAVPLIRADGQPIKIRPDQPGGMTIPDQNDPIYLRKPVGAAIEKLAPPPEEPAPRPSPAALPPSQSQAPPAAAPGAPPSPPSRQQVAAAPNPPAKPAATPTPTAAKPAVASAALKVQLGSLRTPDEAREEWQRVKRENPDLLGKLSAVAVRADLGDKGIYYRLEVGPVGDLTAADRLCRALRQRNLGCTLVR